MLRYWIAGAPGNWTDTANWSASSGGPGGASIPIVDTTAVFDSNGVGNCTIDASVWIAGLQLSSGYSGILSQNSNEMLIGNAGASLLDGTFQGGGDVIRSSGDFYIGGACNFLSTDGSFSCSDSTLTIAPSTGLFAHNNGLVSLDGTQTNLDASSIGFYDLQLNTTDGKLNSSCFVERLLILNDGYMNEGVPGSEIHMLNDVSGRSSYNEWSEGNNLNLIFDGTDEQILQNELGCVFPTLITDKTTSNVICGEESVYVIIKGDNPVTMRGHFIIRDGTFNMNNHDIEAGAIADRTAFIDPGTLILDGNFTINNDFTIDHDGIVIPISDPDISKTFYQYSTNTYKTANGKSRTIMSNTGDIIVEGLICGKGRGFESNRGPGCNSLLTDSSGYVLNGYGASHAGLGHIDTTAVVPEPKGPYGNWETPVSLGSGAGYYHPPLDYLGQEVRGGGAIKLVARSGTIMVNGYINMNGEDGTHAGGAAGGSAWLVGWFIDGTGTIHAEGGSTLLAGGAGGGGGGYISLWYDRTNYFSGGLSVDGKSGGEEGKIFIKQIEPIIEDRFTGDIWNTKWWDHTGSITIDNDLTFNSPSQDYTFPVADSKFTISGKNITAAIDYSPDSTEINQYSAEYLLYVDEANWIGVGRRQTGWFGISSVDGIISASGVDYTNTDMSLRILKNDSTFTFQYYDSTSTPQTIYADVRPELANEVFKIKMILDKPIPGDIYRTDYLRLTSFDIANEYFQLDGTPADQSAVALNVITGTSQYYGIDFYVDGNKVRWDSSGLANFQAPFGLVITDYYILNADDITRRGVWLSYLPSSSQDVAVNVIRGTSQFIGIDFTIIGTRLEWAGRALESLLTVGDELRVIYYYNPWNVTTFSDIIAAGDQVRVMYGWDYTSPDGISTIFDNFKIYDGVIKNAETTESAIYVDPDYGSDSSSGRQLEPLKNLFVATAWAKRGGTVILYDGTHNPTSVARKDLTIRGAEGTKPLITTDYVKDTTGSDWENTALRFYGCQGLIENISIDNAINGIIVENGDFSIVRNTITDTTRPISFINCDPTVVRNRIGNSLYAMDFTSCRFPEIYSNTIFDSSVAVRLLNSPDATISSNTFDNNQTHIVADMTSPAIISNNDLTYCLLGINASTDSSIGVFYNNFYEAATWWNRTPEGDSCNIDQNPLYYDRFNRDYHLNPGSPNINAGILIYDSYKTDYDGATRVPLE